MAEPTTGYTPEEDAFLAAIRARPGNDLPRLVYADWLDERGDPRGPLVRAEIAVAQAIIAAGPDERLEFPRAADRHHITLVLEECPRSGAGFEELIRYARQHYLHGKAGLTLDRDGAVEALGQLPLDLITGPADEVLANATTVRRAGGRVSAVWAGDVEQSPSGELDRAVGAFAAVVADVVSVEPPVSSAWWNNVRPHWNVVLTKMPPDPEELSRDGRYAFLRMFQVSPTKAAATLPLRSVHCYTTREALSAMQQVYSHGGEARIEPASQGGPRL